MKLHDPETEKRLIRIACEVVGPAGFESSSGEPWVKLQRKVFMFGAVVYVLAIIFTWDKDEALDGRPLDALCAILMMYLVRMGQDRIAAAFQTACFFGTLANLPIRGRAALVHIRGIIFRSFWFTPLITSFVASICLHYPAKSPNILATWAMLTAIIWVTPGILQVGWVQRLRHVKIWHWAAYFVIAILVILHLFDGHLFLPPTALAMMDRLIGGILWLFPPAWVFPERVMNGGLILAAIWIAWGAWGWWRWPERMFPGYDRPHDFMGAFGSVSNPGQDGENPSKPIFAEESILPEAPPRPPVNGWVDRIISASIPADEHVVAGSLMAATNHSRAINSIIVFAAFWLLVIGFGKGHIPDTPYDELILMAAWIVPAVVFTVGLLPIGDPLKPAFQPYQLGNMRLPIFSMLPVTLRSLLRITLRIVIVRTVIAVAFTTPFFWLLAKILGFADVGGALLPMIPAIGVVWISSIPAFLAHRLDPYLRRRRGIFPLIFATSLVQIPIGFLWLISGVAGVGFMLLWSQGSEAGKYAFLLLPAALACLAFSASMSRLIFEILHLSLRQRRYDWISKIR